MPRPGNKGAIPEQVRQPQVSGVTPQGQRGGSRSKQPQSQRCRGKSGWMPIRIREEGKPLPLPRPFILRQHNPGLQKHLLPLSLSLSSFSFLVTGILQQHHSGLWVDDLFLATKANSFSNQSHINIPCHSGTAVGMNGPGIILLQNLTVASKWQLASVN